MFMTGWRREMWRFLYIASGEQAADMLTKPLSRMKSGELQTQAWCGPSQEGVIMERLVLVTRSITKSGTWDSYLLAWHLIISYEKGLALMKMGESLHPT